MQYGGGEMVVAEQAPRLGIYLRQRVMDWLEAPFKCVLLGGLFGCSVFAVHQRNHGMQDGVDLGVQCAAISSTIALGSTYVGNWLADLAERLRREEAVEEEPRPGRKPPRRQPPVHNKKNPNPFLAKVRTNGRSRVTAIGPTRSHPQHHSFAQDAQAVQAEVVVEPWEVSFYKVTVAMFENKSITRRDFQSVFPDEDWTKLYYKYVGGKSGPYDFDYGVWKHWRVIEQVDGHGKCAWTADLPTILAYNRKVRRYAERKGWSFP